MFTSARQQHSEWKLQSLLLAHCVCIDAAAEQFALFKFLNSVENCGVWKTFRRKSQFTYQIEMQFYQDYMIQLCINIHWDVYCACSLLVAHSKKLHNKTRTIWNLNINR